MPLVGDSIKAGQKKLTKQLSYLAMLVMEDFLKQIVSVFSRLKGGYTFFYRTTSKMFARNCAMEIDIKPYNRSHLAGLLAILIDTRTTLPYFGKKVCPLRIDQYLKAQWYPEDMPNFDRKFVATDRLTNHIIGAGKVRTNEISYFVSPDFWRLGVASKLMTNLLNREEILTKDTCLFALVARDNFASTKLIEKFGFRFAGIQKNSDRSVSETMLKYIECPTRSIDQFATPQQSP